MKAALLCPGPSLATYQPAGADLTVGVNRAATRFACDAWVCGDPPLIQQVGEQVTGLPLLITSVDGHQVYRDFPRDFGKPLWRGECLCWTAAMEFCPHEYNWVMFSATAALVYCGFCGATGVDVYGADWSGTADFDGVQAGKNRSEERWKLERGIWRAIVGWMGERGITVNRHAD